MKTNRRRAGRGSGVAAALILLLGGSRAATGQEGVVIEVTTTSAEEMIPLEAAIGAELGDDGIEALMNALGRAGIALNDQLDGALSKAGAGDALARLQNGLSGTPPPEPTRMSYTVHLRDKLMAVGADGYPVMVWEIADNGVSGMWFLDAATRRPITIPGTASPGIALPKLDGPGAPVTTAHVSKPVATGRTREMLGYTAWEYSYELSLFRTFSAGQSGDDTPLVDLKIDVRGEAWVAPDSPFRDDVAAFYRTFAAGVGNQGAAHGGHLSGLTSHMAEIAALGVPLQTSESVTTYLILSADPDAALGLPLSKAETTSTVTAIRTAPIDDEQFYGDDDPPEEQAEPAAAAGTPAPQQTPCDCTCAAYARLQEISRMSKEKQRTDPLAMSAAMCAPQCAMTWIACKG